MNFFWKIIFLAMMTLAPFTNSFSTPRAISRWRKPGCTGSVIIFHDDHGIDRPNPKLADDHIACLSKVFEQLENTSALRNKLHVLFECPTAAKHGKIMRKIEDTRGSGYNNILIRKVDKFFEAQPQEHRNICFYNLEHRNTMHLVNSLLAACLSVFINPTDALNGSIMADCFGVCNGVSFENVYTPHLEFIDSCISKSREPFKSVFVDLKKQLMPLIDELKNSFYKCDIEQNIPFTEFMLNDTLEPKRISLIRIGMGDAWPNFLRETVEIRGIDYLMNTPDTDTVSFLTGFNHAENLERCLQQLGYNRCYKITSTPETFPLQAYSEMLLNSKICAHCLKPDASNICSACKMAHYCSPACQKANWSFHKMVCDKKK